MTALLSDRWGDIAWARPPSVDPFVGMSIYSGPAFPGLDWIRRWNVPVLLGYEGTEERAYAGGDAGAEDARQLIGIAHTLPGYIESGCGFWMCAADRPSTPSWALPNITEYFHRAALELLAVGWIPARGLGYGNRDASLAATDGIVAAGIPGDEWGVGTWGGGEGRGANQLPGDSDAALLQSGNTPGLVDGTDTNGMYQPLEYFGAYGGPRATATTEKAKEADMDLVVVPLPWGGHLARLMLADGYKIDQWASDGTDTTEAFGIPRGVSEAARGANLVIVADGDQAVRIIKASDTITAWRDAGFPTTGGGSGGTVVVDEDAIAEKVANKLAQRLAA